jgi:glucuronate isomerase
MKTFMDDNFVLQTDTAQQLYHAHAKNQPIIDYHCHLDPKQIFESSFVSYPRHEYFRRILYNILGNDVEQGLLPASEMPFPGKMVENISFNNANNFFRF